MIEVLIVIMIFLFVVLWEACATGKCDENQSDVQQEKWIKKSKKKRRKKDEEIFNDVINNYNDFWNSYNSECYDVERVD